MFIFYLLLLVAFWKYAFWITHIFDCIAVLPDNNHEVFRMVLFNKNTNDFFSLVCKPLLNAYNSLYMPSKIDGGDFQKFQSLQ